MPPHSSIATACTNTAQLLWHASEPVETLRAKAQLTTSEEEVLQKITHPRRRQQWLTVRVALKHLLTQLGHPYTEIYKDPQGKPHLRRSNWHISLAHCDAWAFVAVDTQKPIGIDIQQPHAKLQNVCTKFLTQAAIQDADNDLEKLCIYWSAKEAIYKAHGGVGISSMQDIAVEAFDKQRQGTLRGTALEEEFIIDYRFCEGHVLTHCMVIDDRKKTGMS